MSNKRNYRFSQNSRKYEWAIRCFDAIGAFFCAAEQHTVDSCRIRSVCFVQLAHIGDFILLLPTLYAFKKNTDKKVFVAVNSENKKLAESLPWIDKVFLIEHPAFERNKKNYRNAIRQVRQIQADVVFELRGDIRIIPLLRLFATYHSLIGYDAGGGGFLLSRVLQFPFDRHITETYKGLFPLFGIGHINPLREWVPDLLPSEATEVPHGHYVCVNVGVGGIAKQWGRENFVALVRMLSGTTPIVLIGKIGALDADYYAEHLGTNSAVLNCINKTTVMGSVHIVQHASLYVGLDTGFTHIATLSGKKVLALYSGTSNRAVWKPLELFSGQVELIIKQVPCGNCGKFMCKDNICMQRITVPEVHQKIMDIMLLSADA